MTTIFKYFMFGKYGCLDTNVRGCCMHVFLVQLLNKLIQAAPVAQVEIYSDYLSKRHCHSSKRQQ